MRELQWINQGLTAVLLLQAVTFFFIVLVLFNTKATPKKPRLIIEFWPNDGGFTGRLKGWPGVTSDGDTVEHIIAGIRDIYVQTIKHEAEQTEMDLSQIEVPQ